MSDDEVWVITWRGGVIDAYLTEAEAEEGRDAIVDSIWAGENEFWTVDQFIDRADALATFSISRQVT